MLHGMQDLSFLAKDWTRAPCTGSVESESLGHQVSPSVIVNVRSLDFIVCLFRLSLSTLK